MLASLVILVLLFLAMMLLPLGLEISSEGGRRRWYVILAGLHIPVPEWITRRIWNRVSSKSNPRAKRQAGFGWSDLAYKFRRILNKQASLGEIFRLDDLRLALDLVVRLLNILRIRVHRLKVLIASPDPAWTGIAYGWACAALSALPADWPVSVDVDWDTDVPQFTYRVEASLIPAQVFIALVKSLGRRYLPKFV